ncbi:MULTISPECIES: nuclear transport factor 2 family protein [unclassified Caulobacter]|nr:MULTISPECIES: nuclear transport factor 2 family protein [unclassified Caulobacter]
MADEAKVVAVEAYLAAFAGGDVAAIAALFAVDAVIEDPVGASPIVG